KGLDLIKANSLGVQGGSPCLAFLAASRVQFGGDSAEGTAAAVELFHAARDAERAVVKRAAAALLPPHSAPAVCATPPARCNGFLASRGCRGRPAVVSLTQSAGTRGCRPPRQRAEAVGRTVGAPRRRAVRAFRPRFARQRLRFHARKPLGGRWRAAPRAVGP